jgi:hypothetical protein
MTPKPIESLDEILAPYFSWESDDCTLCGHHYSHHYWNGSGNPDNAGYSSCKKSECDCDGVFDEKDRLITQTTITLDEERYRPVKQALTALITERELKARITALNDFMKFANNKPADSKVPLGQLIERLENYKRAYLKELENNK